MLSKAVTDGLSPASAGGTKFGLADGVGFEPTNRLHDCRISSPVHSTALPPIHARRLIPAGGGRILALAGTAGVRETRIGSGAVSASLAMLDVHPGPLARDGCFM